MYIQWNILNTLEWLYDGKCKPLISIYIDLNYSQEQNKTRFGHLRDRISKTIHSLKDSPYQISRNQGRFSQTFIKFTHKIDEMKKE